MKKYIQISIIACVSFCQALTITAQDFHLSMWETAAISVNPGLTGMYDGIYRGHLQHRSQWGSLVAKPFMTENFTAERNFKQYGAGLSLLNYRAGSGNFNTLSLYASGGYEVSIDPGKFHHLFCGVQIGIIQNSININNLTFDNQFSISNGGGFDPNLPSNENFTRTTAIAPDVNFGVHWTMQKRRNYFTSYVYKTSTYTPYAGVSMFHLTQPKLVLMNYKNQVYRRFLFYGGCRYKINSEIGVDPNIMVQTQGRVTEVMFGTHGYYYYQPYKIYGMLGVHYRTKDALILSIGALKDEYALKFSYDINTSKLKAYSSGRGAFEISFTYTMLDEKSYPMF